MCGQRDFHDRPQALQQFLPVRGAHSRNRSIATLMLYVDEHDRQKTQATLADLVPETLTG